MPHHLPIRLRRLVEAKLNYIEVVAELNTRFQYNEGAKAYIDSIPSVCTVGNYRSCLSRERPQPSEGQKVEMKGGEGVRMSITDSLKRLPRKPIVHTQSKKMRLLSKDNQPPAIARATQKELDSTRAGGNKKRTNPPQPDFTRYEDDPWEM